MAVLSDLDIKSRLHHTDPLKKLVVVPFDEQIGFSSIDLTLGNEVGFRRRGAAVIDPRNRTSVESSLETKVLRSEDEITMMPKDVVVWLSKEHIDMPSDLVGFITSRSSWMQLFISTSGFVGAGYRGKLVLEVINNHEIAVVLRPGDRICQIIFMEEKTASSANYQGKYAGRDHIEPSKVWKGYTSK